MTSVREALAVKGLEFLRAVVPGASRVVVLLDPSDPVHTRAFKELEGAVRSSGIYLLAINVAGPTNCQAEVGRVRLEGTASTFRTTPSRPHVSLQRVDRWVAYAISVV
jgi:ABC-type uncharacterized transport system substrate-binding protein